MKNVYPLGIMMVISLVFTSCGVSSSKMRREDTTRTYSAPYEKIFDKGLAIVREEGWTLENANKDVGFITARSGMSWKTNAGQTISIQFTKVSDGRTQVFVSARMNQSGLQAFGWGESSAFVRKVIAAFEKEFNSYQSIGAPK